MGGKITRRGFMKVASVLGAALGLPVTTWAAEQAKAKEKAAKKPEEPVKGQPSARYHRFYERVCTECEHLNGTETRFEGFGDAGVCDQCNAPCKWSLRPMWKSVPSKDFTGELVSIHGRPEVFRRPRGSLPLTTAATGSIGTLMQIHSSDQRLTGWVPCDGRQLSAEEYPQLAAVLRKSMEQMFGTQLEEAEMFAVPNLNGKCFGPGPHSKLGDATNDPMYFLIRAA